MITDTRQKFRPILTRQEAVALLRERNLSKHTLESWCALDPATLNLPAGQTLRFKVRGMKTHRYHRDALLLLCNA